MEAQARLSPSRERGGGHEVSLIAEEVLTTGSSWRQRVGFLFLSGPREAAALCGGTSLYLRGRKTYKIGGYNVEWVGKWGGYRGS